MEQTIFKEGDLVRHRGSKVEGVICDVYISCKCEAHTTLFHCASEPSKCDDQPNNMYSVNVGFDNSIDGVCGMSLEYACSVKRNAEAHRLALSDSGS